MDIEKLWEILHKERNTASLQELPENFCDEVRKYVEQLKNEKGEVDERRGELVEDEIRNVRMKAEDIIRRRIGKIVKLASSGIKAVPKGMLAEEESIFAGVKGHVEEGKARIFALILDDNGNKEKSEGGSEKVDEVIVGSMFKEVEASSTKAGNEELHIVRVLEDIPTFMGTDGRIYKIKKEDVIMLPKTNAEILCKRGVAVRFSGEAKKMRVGK